ncbi:hypothetical protein N9H39_06620 [Gammaproteobacteria bacterium]|nr:hypothetical protein [Gammaproteobacteria bacterium]
MSIRASLILLMALVAPNTMATEIKIQQHSMQRSIDYVRDLDLDCTLTDGYVCANTEEDDFMRPESWQRMIPAVYMRAWQIAYEDFRQIADLSAEQKDLKHYKIGFTENDTQYIVVLLGLALPYIDEQGEPQGITSAVFGRSVKYWIDKKTNQIAKRLFYK